MIQSGLSRLCLRVHVSPHHENLIIFKKMNPVSISSGYEKSTENMPMVCGALVLARLLHMNTVTMGGCLWKCTYSDNLDDCKVSNKVGGEEDFCVRKLLSHFSSLCLLYNVAVPKIKHFWWVQMYLTWVTRVCELMVSETKSQVEIWADSRCGSQPHGMCSRDIDDFLVALVMFELIVLRTGIQWKSCTYTWS